MADTHSALRKRAHKDHAEKLGRFAGKHASRGEENIVKKAVRQHEKHDHPGQKLTKLKFADGGPVEGEPSRPRLDRKAGGGRSKGGKPKGNHVVILNAPQGAPRPVPVPVPAGGPAAPLRPPVAPPPAAPAGIPPHPPIAGPGMPPPGMPPGGLRRRGGAAFKSGGAVQLEHAGAKSGEGRIEKMHMEAGRAHKENQGEVEHFEDKPAVGLPKKSGGRT